MCRGCSEPKTVWESWQQIPYKRIFRKEDNINNNNNNNNGGGGGGGDDAAAAAAAADDNKNVTPGGVYCT